jgi:lysophospholipase L1-like esterase
LFSEVKLPHATLSAAALLTAGILHAQDGAVLANTEVNQLCARTAALMEAGGIAIPELNRAAAPILENARQSCTVLRVQPGRAEPTYTLLTNVRAYLALFDAVPKPYPFPDAAQKQVAELRDHALRLEAHFRALIANRDRQLASPDPANLARYAEANRKAGNPAPGKPRVVFFGDSITDFWRLNEYFPDRDYLNRGIAGQTSGQLLQRIQADVLDLHPEAVVLLIGTNDLARQTPVAAIENTYKSLADILTANRVKLVFASVLPVSDHHKDQDPAYERTPGRPLVYIKALNGWIQRFCSQRGCTYLDYYSATVDDSGQFKEDLSDDGLHPNAKGYRVMAPLAAAAIEKTLQPAAAVSTPKKGRR